MTNQSEHPTVFQTNQFAHIVLLVGALLVVALLFSPFFSSILWAVVLVYAFYPLYGRVLRATGGRAALSAFYFFRDGNHIVEWAHENLPITRGERRRLVLTRFDEVVKGAM